MREQNLGVVMKEYEEMKEKLLKEEATSKSLLAAKALVNDLTEKLVSEEGERRTTDLLAELRVASHWIRSEKTLYERAANRIEELQNRVDVLEEALSELHTATSVIWDEISNGELVDILDALSAPLDKAEDALIGGP